MWIKIGRDSHLLDRALGFRLWTRFAYRTTMSNIVRRKHEVSFFDAEKESFDDAYETCLCWCVFLLLYFSWMQSLLCSFSGQNLYAYSPLGRIVHKWCSKSLFMESSSMSVLSQHMCSFPLSAFIATHTRNLKFSTFWHCSRRNCLLMLVIRKARKNNIQKIAIHIFSRGF